jgi:hypothetical protein
MVFTDSCRKSNVSLRSFNNDLEEEQDVTVNIDEYYSNVFKSVCFSGKFQSDSPTPMSLRRVGSPTLVPSIGFTDVVAQLLGSRKAFDTQTR